MKRRGMAAMLAMLLLLLAAYPAWGSHVREQDPGAGVRLAAETGHQTVLAHVEQYYDHYFQYYSGEEFDALMEDYSGTFGGVGITLTTGEDNNVVIVSVIPGSPSEGTALQAGDIIEKVDGETVLGWGHDLTVTRIRGEVGTPVTLVVRHTDGTLSAVTIYRDVIVSTSLDHEIIEELPHTGYIHISEFTSQTPQEFYDAIIAMDGECNRLKNLIIDLRSNGGGNFWSALAMAEFFIPEEHLLVQEKTADGLTKYASFNGAMSDINLVLLMNAYSASASEVLAGALRDEAGAVLIGEQSFGKGITQHLVTLDSGCGLRYTNGRYYNPSGYDLHGVGLPPDVELPLTEDMTYDQYWSTDPAVGLYLAAALRQFPKL